MAKVPDLGSDFAQKLLRDLRRRREKLGFDTAPAPAQRGAATANAAAPRDAYSNSAKPLQVQKPRQAAPAPRAGRPEAAANRVHRQGSSGSVAGPGNGKPRRHDAPPPAAQSRAIVPFQGGGGGGGKQTAPAATNAGIDVQMAVALALSNSGKLQNVQLVARHGAGPAVFYGEPGRAEGRQRHLLAPGAHVGKVAIGVQKLNDILMAYSSGAAGGARRGSVEIGKQLLRGAMDLEESLSMLMMLQDASDYMESSGNGKVLLLEGGKENWRRRSTSSASARLVEIVEEDSETEQTETERSSSDAFLQMVPHSKSQSSSPNHRSTLQLTTVSSNVSNRKKDDPNARVPNLIAKLMGLENLPSARAAAERKGTERFVKPEAVPRKTTAATAMVGTLPIRIVASERVPSKGQIKNFQAREWNISLSRSEESVLSDRFSHLTTDKQVRQTMRQVLSRQESRERRVSLSPVVDEKIVQQEMKPTEEFKLQKTDGVESRSDAGKKMNFLQRLRKNGKSKPVKEEKDIVRESGRKLGKKQSTGINQRDSEVNSRRTRDRFNKENLASSENKSEGKNGRTDQMRRQAQSKSTDKQIMEKKVQNHRRMQIETARQNLEHKRSLKSEPIRTNEDPEYITLIPLNNGERTKVDYTAGCKPSDNTPSDDGMFKQSAAETEDSKLLIEKIKDGIFKEHRAEMKDSSTTRCSSSDKSEKQFTEEIKDGIFKQCTTEIEDSSTTRRPSSDQYEKQFTEEIKDGIFKQCTEEIKDSSTTRRPSSDQYVKQFTEEIKDGIFKQAAEEIKDRSTIRGASSDQSEKQVTEEIKDGVFNQSTAEMEDSSATIEASSDQYEKQLTEEIKDGLFKQSAAEMEDSSTTNGASSDQSEKQLTEEIKDVIFKQSPVEMEDSSTTRGSSSDQSEKQLIEEIKDPTSACSIAPINDDRDNQTASETRPTPETFSEGEQEPEQMQQMKELDNQSRNGLDHIAKFSNPIEVKSSNMLDGIVHQASSETLQILEISSEGEQEQKQQLQHMKEANDQPINGLEHINHKMNAVSCDSFTENQLLLTEMLLKDPYLLETAKAITGFHVPVNIANADTGRWLEKGNKVLSDIGREVIRRKGKRTEAMVDVNLARVANLKLQSFDDLIRELDGDIQSLNIPKKPHQQSDNSMAENLKMILRSDMENTHSDANSVWDFGWNRIWDAPIEKNEVVKDLEKNILGGIITDVTRDLIDVSMRHGCCSCEA